ncbi:hypothetical protein RQP46_003202 [Phenoliferia psychrophenolica]
MLAPLAPTTSAAARARRSLHDSLETAEQLANEAEHNYVPNTDGTIDTEDSAEDLEPDDARLRVEDVYEPLMGSGRAASGDEGPEYKVRKLEVHISYLCFFVLGACILLPWNSEMVAGVYFRARLEGSSLQAAYVSWMSLAFMGSNLFFLYLANKTQHGANLGRRISVSIVVTSSILALGIFSTRVQEINPTFFFFALMVCTVILSACASYLQNAVVALSSRFGPSYLQGILSGQGAIGLAVATLQFVAAYTASSGASKSPPPSPLHLQLRQLPNEIFIESAPALSIRNSAFSFFLTVGIFSTLGLLVHLILIKLPLYRLVIQSQADSKAGAVRKGPSASVVERKVRKLGIAICWIYVVTLSIFPAITSSVLSVSSEGEGNGSRLGSRLTDPALFVPLGFIVFNAGDWIGRAMPQVKALAFTDWRWLAGGSAARVLFIPFFLLCNVQTGGDQGGSPFINSDVVFMLLMLTFSISNGYFSTLIMLAAIQDPSLEENEIDVAATCLAFYLTSGLAIGSLVSFPIRATSMMDLYRDPGTAAAAMLQLKPLSLSDAKAIVADASKHLFSVMICLPAAGTTSRAGIVVGRMSLGPMDDQHSYFDIVISNEYQGLGYGHEALKGFVQEGVKREHHFCDGKWQDTVQVAMLISDWKSTRIPARS